MNEKHPEIAKSEIMKPLPKACGDETAGKADTKPAKRCHPVLDGVSHAGRKDSVHRCGFCVLFFRIKDESFSIKATPLIIDGRI